MSRGTPERDHPERDPTPSGSKSEAAQGALGLTGFWTGVLDSEQARFEATPFHAFLCEEGGLLSGEMIEPNLFSPERVLELFASVEGWRDGGEIAFVKTYEDAIGAGFATRFEGALIRERSTIIGVWRRLGGPEESGPFIMNRAADALVTIASSRRR
ncbi:MAG: hypothetical protein AAGM38_12985 [Pseudomonadota bacterium]